MNIDDEMARIRERLAQMESTRIANLPKTVENLPAHLVERGFRDGRLTHGMIAPDRVGRLFMALGDPVDELGTSFKQDTRRRI